MKKYEWNNINEMFNELNSCKCNYVILRNYEELLNDNFYCEGHADIDFLTDNVNLFVDTIKAYPRFIEDDKIHYLVNINGVEVILDVRSVGDDYYCKKWEKNILLNKIMINNWYVTDRINYYYSLVYHAILQKKEFSDDYKERLAKMSLENGIEANDINDHINYLVNYMKQNKYYFTYPDDIWVPLNINYVPNDMVRKQYKLVLRKIKRFIIRILVWIKHKILRS